MRIELGRFEISGWVVASASARVIAMGRDFERLELREFESGDRLSPCLRWCHDKVGKGYECWELVSSEEVDTFYFRHAEDAERFWAMYGSPPSEGNKKLLLAA